MARSLEAILSDILGAIEGVTDATRDTEYEAFVKSWVLKHAAQRAIEIISEASRRIPPQLKTQHPEIPWRNIETIGNILRHEYHNVADDVVWEILRKRLPSLKQAILEMAGSQKQ
jgi:uncharacterized protein with HEPN domain